MIVSLSPMASLLYSLPFFAFILSLPLNQGNRETAKPKVVMEEGYMVTTLIDGHKLKINPHEVLSRPGTSDLLILDSSGSAFYTVSFPISQEAAVNRFSGDGIAGYLDGELSSARFNGPRSFAVDLKGNVYVADKINRVIRKISGSGVTTIAGNYSKEGKADGPGKVASFSNDFELAFIPEKCVLLVSDHGNQLVRQINLKPEDCVRGSHSALGAVSVWALGLGLSCLIGMIIGIVVRPYVIPHDRSSVLPFRQIWRHYLIILVKLVQTIFSDTRSAVASCRLYALPRSLLQLSLSHLLLMFSINLVQDQTLYEDSVSLLDSSVNSREVTMSQPVFNQLQDLMELDGPIQQSSTKNDLLKDGEGDQERSYVKLDGNGGIDKMIQANLMGFAETAVETISLSGSSVGSSGLVKRR